MNFKNLINKIDNYVQQGYVVYKRSIHMVGLEHVIRDVSLEDISNKYFRINGEDINEETYIKIKNHLEPIWEKQGKQWQERTFY